MIQRDEIQEFPYWGCIYRTFVCGDDEETVKIYEGEMDETMVTDDEGRLLQTASYIVSIPLIVDDDGDYVIPIKGDIVELERYGQTMTFTVDNAEPSQLMGVSVYCTRNKW